MLNEGLEGQKQWLQLLKLDNFVHIHVKNEKDPWCILTPISLLLIVQNSKSRTVLKSSEPADFKTDSRLSWIISYTQLFCISIRIIWKQGGTKLFITCFHPCHPLVLTFAARCLSWCLSADTGPEPSSWRMLSRQ